MSYRLVFAHALDASEPDQFEDEVKGELIQHVRAMKVENSANIHTVGLTDICRRLFVIAFNLYIGDMLNKNKLLPARTE